MRPITLVLFFLFSLTHLLRAADDPYLIWATKNVGSATSPAASPHADPDGDGLENVLEYALDFDPLAFSVSPTATETPVPQLTGDQSAFVITATIRTDDPGLSVFPQVSADNATWFPFVVDRTDLNLTDSFYIVKVEDLVPRRGMQQITWAVRPNVAGIDPHYLRLTAIRDGSATDAPSAGPKAAKATPRPVRRAITSQASTPAIPGLVFTSQNTAAAGADLVSNTVVIRGLKGKVLVTAPAGVTLIVNSIDRGQSYLVGNGDTLALKTKAPGTVDQSIDGRIQVGSGSILWKSGARRAATLTPPRWHRRRLHPGQCQRRPGRRG